MKQYVTVLLEMQTQLKILHWQTKSFAQHEAFGKTYDELADLIDEFVEVNTGKKGRFQLGKSDVVELQNYNPTTMTGFIDSSIDFLINMNGILDPKKDSDLLTIRDEMLGSFNKLKYLLTLS